MLNSNKLNTADALEQKSTFDYNKAFDNSNLLISVRQISFLQGLNEQDSVNYPKNKVSSNNRTWVSAPIYRVTLTKTWFKKKKNM